MMMILKLNPNSPVMTEKVYRDYRNNCINAIEYNKYMDCMNSIFSIYDTNSNQLAIIGGRRAKLDEDLVKRLCKYIPTKNGSVYTIDMYYSKQDKYMQEIDIDLIRTFLADKNDGFVIFKPSYELKHNIFKFIDFEEIEIDGEIYYIKEPTVSKIKRR